MATFIDYCEKGNIEYIKKMSLKDCDLENGFRWACIKGHYNIVRYLIELYKSDSTCSPININAYNEDGFRWACTHGYYEIVRYLVELYKNDRTYKRINIHACNEDGFRKACFFEYYIIANYLLRTTKNNKFGYSKQFNNYHMVFKKFEKYLL
jgi:hypothetical protein